MKMDSSYFAQIISRMFAPPLASNVKIEVLGSLKATELLNGPTVMSYWNVGDSFYSIFVGPKAASLDDAQLAAIICHELGHIHLGHLPRMLNGDVPDEKIFLGPMFIVPEFELEADLFAARLGHARAVLEFLKNFQVRYTKFPMRFLVKKSILILTSRRISQMEIWLSRFVEQEKVVSL
jgi:hypothetical protein